MRGVNLDLFDFDYDLTWAAFFMSADEKIYGRYGGRDAGSPDGRQSLLGLRFAMAEALAVHRLHPPAMQTVQPSTKHTVEEYLPSLRWQSQRCVHCHQVYEVRREALQAQAKWSRANVWVYPLPENIGLQLDISAGNRVGRIIEDSPAQRIGLVAGDRLREINGLAIASIADAQYALHRAQSSVQVRITWLHDAKTISGTLPLPPDWRKTDLSWRWSLRSLEPTPWVYGEDLSPPEKKKLGLSHTQLAFYQGSFVSAPARHAGIESNDVIVGIDGRSFDLTARQFLAYVRLNHRIGDRVTYDIIRNGRRIELPLILVSRPRF